MQLCVFLCVFSDLWFEPPSGRKVGWLYPRCLALKTWNPLLSSHLRGISRDSCEVHSTYGNIPKGCAIAFLCASRRFGGRVYWNERRVMITYKSIRKLFGQPWLMDFATSKVYSMQIIEAANIQDR